MNHQGNAAVHTTHPVILSETDYHQIKKLLGSVGTAEHEMSLANELARAIVVKSDAFPPHAIGILSRVLVLDLETDRRKSFTLVLPGQADIRLGRVSVLSPMAAALIGFRQGETVRWKMPGGLKHFRILEVDNSARAGTA